MNTKEKELTDTEKQLIERINRDFSDLHNDYWRNTIKSFILKEVRDARVERDREIEKVGSCEEIQGCNYVVIPLEKWQALKGGEEKEKEYELRYCPHCNRMVNSLDKYSSV